MIDNVEHPALVPGKPVAVYPSSLGGLNYSPASYDPQTNYVYNAAAETGSALQQQTPAQEKVQQLLLGNTFLGLANGDFGQYLQTGWKDYGSISAIDVATGKVAWKINTPQPERGGVTTTASGLGFAGGGDGVLRAFDAKTGNVLWKFQTGFQIASGAVGLLRERRPSTSRSLSAAPRRRRTAAPSRASFRCSGWAAARRSRRGPCSRRCSA